MWLLGIKMFVLFANIPTCFDTKNCCLQELFLFVYIERICAATHGALQMHNMQFGSAFTCFSAEALCREVSCGKDITT